MLFDIQRRLTQRLWDGYVGSIPQFSKIFAGSLPALDHYAVIDLTSRHSGISYLRQVFELLGFKENGCGYLPEKQNDFVWMLPKETIDKPPAKALPQPIIADFRNEELSPKTRAIVEKYASYEDKYFDLSVLRAALKYAGEGFELAYDVVANEVASYLNRRPWPKPTIKEYMAVREENSLLAWVLLFGRRINHFGMGIYAMDKYKGLGEFNEYVSKVHGVKLNGEGGLIKGSAAIGIEQSSTVGDIVFVDLGGEIIEVNDSFMEFVWRHPIKESPKIMGDYYLNFTPTNANKVVESLYI